MTLSALKYGNTHPDLIRSSFLLFILYIISDTVGICFDTVSYFNDRHFFLITINMINIIVAIIMIVLFLSGKINIQVATLIFAYLFAANLIATDIYNFLTSIPDWQTILFRNAYVYTITVVVVGFICATKHIVILNVAYLTMLITIFKFSEKNYFTDNVFIIMLLVFGFTIAVVFYKNQLTKNLQQKLALQQEISIRDKEILQKEAQQMKDKTDNLQNLIQQKNRELASNALLIAQHNERNIALLKKIRMLYDLKTDEQKKELQEIESLLSPVMYTKFWERFQKHFEDVHQDFYKKLTLNFPDLSPAEQKLAAFIRLGLTSKEIALLTLNTKESIDVGRSRLRKKLLLDRSQNIEFFLSNL